MKNTEYTNQFEGLHKSLRAPQRPEFRNALRLQMQEATQTSHEQIETETLVTTLHMNYKKLILWLTLPAATFAIVALGIFQFITPDNTPSIIAENSKLSVHEAIADSIDSFFNNTSDVIVSYTQYEETFQGEKASTGESWSTHRESINIQKNLETGYTSADLINVIGTNTTEYCWSFDSPSSNDGINCNVKTEQVVADLPTTVYLEEVAYIDTNETSGRKYISFTADNSLLNNPDAYYVVYANANPQNGDTFSNTEGGFGKFYDVVENEIIDENTFRTTAFFNFYGIGEESIKRVEAPTLYVWLVTGDEKSPVYAVDTATGQSVIAEDSIAEKILEDYRIFLVNRELKRVNNRFDQIAGATSLVDEEHLLDSEVREYNGREVLWARYEISIPTAPANNALEIWVDKATGEIFRVNEMKDEEIMYGVEIIDHYVIEDVNTDEYFSEQNMAQLLRDRGIQ